MNTLKKKNQKKYSYIQKTPEYDLVSKKFLLSNE